MNCAGYMNDAELPQDWCSQMEYWSICGIHNGVIRGDGYGCTFVLGETGYCKETDSGHECNIFQKPPSNSFLMKKISIYQNTKGD